MTCSSSNHSDWFVSNPYDLKNNWVAPHNCFFIFPTKIGVEYSSDKTLAVFLKCCRKKSTIS